MAGHRDDASRPAIPRSPAWSRLFAVGDGDDQNEPNCIVAHAEKAATKALLDISRKDLFNRNQRRPSRLLPTNSRHQGPAKFRVATTPQHP
ncbi:MAG: hypothetical protein AAF334_06120 [Pseudomonadota bacterium]